MDDIPLSEAEIIYDRIEQLLKERYGISHIALQAEVNKCCGKGTFAK